MKSTTRKGSASPGDRIAPAAKLEARRSV